MLKLDVTADVAKATEHLSDLAQQHVPNAAAKALTRTAGTAAGPRQPQQHPNPIETT